MDFDELVWNSARDDYEAGRTVATDLSRELARDVSPREVDAAFLRLAAQGRFRAFAYATNEQRFVEVPVHALAGVAEPWFRAVEPHSERAAI